MIVGIVLTIRRWWHHRRCRPSSTLVSPARKAAASTGGDGLQCLRLHHLLQARPPLSPGQRLCLSSALDALWLSLSTALSTATPAVLPLLRLDGLLLRRRQSSPPPPLPLSPTHCLCDSSAVDMLVGIVLVVRRLQHDCVSAASTAADTLWHRLHVSRSQLSCWSASCSRSDAVGTIAAAAAAAPHWCLSSPKISKNLHLVYFERG